MCSAMLHGLGDCTPEQNCGCLAPRPSPSLENPYRTVAEVATMFAVTRATVRQWLRDDKIKGDKLPGGDWRILQSEIERFAQTMYGENS